MYSKWSSFFAELQRGAGEPAQTYAHASGATYALDAEVGHGQYGRVYSYLTRSECDPRVLPKAFCVKCVTVDASIEVEAVRALRALTLCNPRAGGFVPAYVLREHVCRSDCNCESNCKDSNSPAAEIAMPLYAGSLGPLAGKMAVEEAARIVRGVARTVSGLWLAGLAYTDIKVGNVLRCGRTCVLGDLGSIVPRGAVNAALDDEEVIKGIFTFPPRRALDGIVEPREGDMVWSLGTLLMTLVRGVPWTGKLLSVDGFAKDPVLVGAVAGEVRAEADRLRGYEGRLGARCADALDVAADAWEERQSATLRAFRVALREVNEGG